ncbi:hypothetical protein M407DRAFT_29851, partial [Tulasnella calospora MUT 4182]
TPRRGSRPLRPLTAHLLDIAEFTAAFTVAWTDQQKDGERQDLPNDRHDHRSLRPYQIECDVLPPPSEMLITTLPRFFALVHLFQNRARSPLLAADAGPKGLRHIRKSLELNQINSPNFANDRHVPLAVRSPPTATSTPSPPCYQDLPTHSPDLQQPIPQELRHRSLKNTLLVDQQKHLVTTTPTFNSLPPILARSRAPSSALKQVQWHVHTNVSVAVIGTLADKSVHSHLDGQPCPTLPAQ